MMSNSLLGGYDPYWRKLLSKFISSSQHQKALSILDNIITNEVPLFKNDPVIQSERGIALLLKIELLRRLGRDLDALAWLCLECDIHPNNNLAEFLRDQLKYNLNLEIISESNKQLFQSTKFIESKDWPGVAGMHELKLKLNNYVINPINNPRHYEAYKIKPPSGLLLYGPPGCGKTHIARRIADKIHYNFIEIKPSDLGSTYVHGTQGKIADLFNKAKEDSPTLIFLDEFDALVPSRENISHHYKSEVNEFLVQLNDAEKRDILIVAATNRLSEIDKAILRPGRMDLKIFVANPDLESRVELFKMFMKDRKQEKINYNQLSEYTENYTCAEINSIVDHAAIEAAQSSEAITTDHLIDIILKHPPSLKEEDIAKMKNEAFE